ncbi:uncharacterized protein LOC114413091 isoform X1 [Glycine soja]|uniref:uncharacterized protein LOC114413091 isoform X1 n=1 Tax=Glycine soja TaxID=3848 RepID=UPI00103E6897|nr:uncharacterized protein LOC114413091 isoform X1 [Glycine soja]
MLLTCYHHPFPHSFSSTSTHSLCTTNRNCNLSLSFSIVTSRPLHLTTQNLNLTAQRFNSLTVRADSFCLRSEHVAVAGVSNFDSLLSLLEFSCLLSSAVASAAAAVVAGSKNELLVGIGTRAAPFGGALLVVGVLVGAWIRRRQWRRACVETGKGGLEVNLLERIEKLEEDMRSSATVVRVLSRQLEKLGVRFRVTRKALKDPIAETAALAQKNSEAARALAVQSDILEKELGEIQQVLLAMQEQQRKQLDLILAIGKASKLWESKHETSERHDTLEMSNSAEDEVKQESTSNLLWIQVRRDYTTVKTN